MTDYRYAWANGHRWVWWYVRRRRFVAALRVAWVTFIQGWPGEACQECGRRYVLWHADDALYSELTGNWDEPARGLFCPACFDRKADRAGIVLVWEPRVRMRNGQLFAAARRRFEAFQDLADGSEEDHFPTEAEEMTAAHARNQATGVDWDHYIDRAKIRRELGTEE